MGEMVPSGAKPMKSLGSCTRSGRFSRFARRWHRPRSAVLSLMLLGLSIGTSNAQTTTTSQPREHVYLLRGFANVFSLGMDQIAAKLQQQGIHATVDNYLAWPSLAEQAAAEYKSGRTRAIILVGHSSGATAVTEMAARLSQLGVPVKLAIGLDPTSRMTTTGHVDRYINYYIAHGFGDPVDRGQGFSGVLQNVDLEHMANVGISTPRRPARRGRQAVVTCMAVVKVAALRSPVLRSPAA